MVSAAASDVQTLSAGYCVRWTRRARPSIPLTLWLSGATRPEWVVGIVRFFRCCDNIFGYVHPIDLATNKVMAAAAAVKYDIVDVVMVHETILPRAAVAAVEKSPDIPRKDSSPKSDGTPTIPPPNGGPSSAEPIDPVLIIRKLRAALTSRRVCCSHADR